MDSLERRVERLTSVLIIQSILLAFVVLIATIRTAPIAVFCLIIALPILVIYRQSLPQWARAIRRFAAQFRASPPPSSDPNPTTTTHTPAR